MNKLVRWLSVLWVALLFFSVTHAGVGESKGSATKEELSSLYQRYFEAKDQEKIRTLVYWPGVLDRDRDSFSRSVDYDLQFKIKKIEMAPLDKNRTLEYTTEGTTYRPTLEPVGQLVVSYESQDSIKNLSTSYLVGVKDNRYYIVLASPVPK